MDPKQTNDKSCDEGTLAVPSASGHVDPLPPADDLFAELDDRRVGEGRVSWLTEVAAIHVVQNEAWVQVAPAGESSRSVILRLSARVTATHALATLAAFWSQTADEAAAPMIQVLQVV